MIPTMLLFGLVLGRWPWIALVGAAVLWPAMLLTSNDPGGAVLLGGAVLAVVNAGIGVLVHQVCLRTCRHFRNTQSPALTT